MRWWWLGAIGLACAGARPAVKPPPPSLQPKKAPEERVTQYDLHHTGKPDVWEYTVTTSDAEGKPVDRLVRREMDMNGDGRVDLVTWFDEHGQPEKEALDLDFDGRADQVNTFEDGRIARKERDFDGDGHPDEIELYEKGQKVRVERDTNRDGRIDTWEYFENGRLARTGEDTDGDGKIDRWTTPPDAAGAGP